MDAAVFLTYLALFYNIIDPAKTLSTSFSNMQKGSCCDRKDRRSTECTVNVDDNPNGKKLVSFNNSD